jgi:hypothetical protein
MRVSKARIAEAIAASGTSLTELFGVGPVVAAMLIGYTGDVARFGSRDHFAAYTGAAPIEMSSGGRIIHRLSRRGNRQLNHALHITAITQIRFPHSPGRAFFERKVAEGKTKKEAVRALKRRIADAVYRQLIIDARALTGPGGQRGTALQSSEAGSTPQRPALRISHSRARTNARSRRTPRRRRRPPRPERRTRKRIDNKEEFVLGGGTKACAPSLCALVRCAARPSADHSGSSVRAGRGHDVDRRCRHRGARLRGV